MQNSTFFKLVKSKLFLSIFVLGGLSSCSIYPNKFQCGEARGLGCVMLRDIDMQIKSGQIEEAYRVKKHCRGNHCSPESSILNEDIPILAPTNKVTIHPSREIDAIDDENNLYF